MDDRISFDIEKSIYSSLNAIGQLQCERVYKILSPETPLNNLLSSIEKIVNEDFLCKVFCEGLNEPIQGRKSAGYGAFEEMCLVSDEDSYYIKAKSVLSISRSLYLPSLLEFKLTHFQKGRSDEFNNKLLRLIIPVQNSPNLGAISDTQLKIDNHYFSAGLADVLISGKQFQLYKGKEDNANFLVIDSINLVSFEEFKQISNSIITAYALITGDLHLGEYYYHVINDDYNTRQRVLYEKNEPAAVTGVTLLNHIDFKDHLENTTSSKELHHHCVPMSTAVFSSLCQLVNDDAVYARCCRFIIEGHQSKQQLLKGGIYSIGIETIAGLIY